MKNTTYPCREKLESIRVSLGGDDIDASPFFLPLLAAHNILKYIGAIVRCFVARKSCANHRILKLPHIQRFLKLLCIWRQTGRLNIPVDNYELRVKMRHTHSEGTQHINTSSLTSDRVEQRLRA